MDAEEGKRAFVVSNDMATSMSVSGKRERPPVDVADHLNGPHDGHDKRSRADRL